ncbi:CPBP family intramembrane metalloprotease [Bacillus sp. BRMEA1]|uniref:CPBP family intramembrane glutamic endopeptidase n=1 Tax=Neobacillus endophyticus TaxID=2738405 RepID=UPI00156323DB|nr:CPBP family intramembrane glutamic endopeptidase [Neobacillus endophyticus]NRD77747.1 CPBP family intramembrane metalloprotease [Neobacillus endophyticus]
MMKTRIYAPAFLLSPAARKKVDTGRLYTDVMGLGLVYTFGSLFPDPLQWILSIYTIMAWVTILTVDPTRLPDAAATKINQHKAWRYLGLSLPLYAGLMGILLWKTGSPGVMHPISLGSTLALIINGCMLELYFRNVLQVKLRQLGLSVITAICVQSLAFALHFYVSVHSFSVSAGAFALGIINGLIVYKTRSISPLFIITIIWLFLFG